jgi:hypothetical protein
VVENQQETPKNHGMFGNFVGVKHGLTVRIWISESNKYICGIWSIAGREAPTKIWIHWGYWWGTVGDSAIKNCMWIYTIAGDLSVNREFCTLNGEHGNPWILVNTWGVQRQYMGIESINGNFAIKNWDLGISLVLLPEAGDHCFYPYIWRMCNCQYFQADGQFPWLELSNFQLLRTHTHAQTNGIDRWPSCWGPHIA